MKSICNKIRLQYTDDSTELVLVIQTPRKEAQTDIATLKEILAKGKILTVEIKRWNPKRSKDANSYFWVLVGKIAKVLRTSEDEVYIEMLTRYGQREPELVSVVAEGAEGIYRATKNHCVEVGESELNGKTFKHLAILRGSSTYLSNEMSILIDGIISDAKELDIETMSDRELQSLKDS